MMKNSVAKSRSLSSGSSAASLSGTVRATSASLLRVNSLAWTCSLDGGLDGVFDFEQAVGLSCVASPGAKAGSASGKSCSCTLPLVKGACSHASSAVKARIGASSLADAGEDLVHRGLRGAAARRVRARRNTSGPWWRRCRSADRSCGAEVVERVEDLAELVGLVGLAALGDHGVEALEDPAVEKGKSSAGATPSIAGSKPSRFPNRMRRVLRRRR